jgi:hypothetical protein
MSIRILITVFVIAIVLPGAAPARAQDISPNQIALARELITVSGMSRSLDLMLPQLLDQLTRTVTRTRPEILKDVSEALNQMKPELDQRHEELIVTVAKIFAKHMSEQEMKDCVAFFASPSGKKYVTTQPVVLDEVVVAMDDWTHSASQNVLTLLRAQLKKKNIEF